ncbi:MAG: hypothetical protein PHY92_05835 [Alphaproteobacteria bacterium]|nr:hypothetical protein [Alphaproteobacteria bacterium]
MNKWRGFASHVLTPALLAGFLLAGGVNPVFASGDLGDEPVLADVEDVQDEDVLADTGNESAVADAEDYEDYAASGGAEVETVFADVGDEIIMADAEVLYASDMEETRGGFIDPTGLIFRFAVDVRTRIDGIVSYARSLVLEPGIGGHLQASSTTKIQEAPNLPVGTIASIIENGNGIVVDDNSGKTTVLNQTPTGSIASVITNTADNRVVSQTMDINIILNNIPNLRSHGHGSGGFSAFSQGIRSRAMGHGR